MLNKLCVPRGGRHVGSPICSQGSPLSLIELCRQTVPHTVVRFVRNAEILICAACKNTSAYSRSEFSMQCYEFYLKKGFDLENWNIFCFRFTDFLPHCDFLLGAESERHQMGGQRWRGLITLMRICDVAALFVYAYRVVVFRWKQPLIHLKKHLNKQTPSLYLLASQILFFPQFHFFFAWHTIDNFSPADQKIELMS